MPWLVGTALRALRSAVTEKRGTFKSWTVPARHRRVLAVAPGTFLVRSAFSTSVSLRCHRPTRGVFILIFLGHRRRGSLTLYVLGEERSAPAAGSHPVSPRIAPGCAQHHTCMVIGGARLRALGTL
jgi:cytochrome c-type biogenesis protein CcmF